MPNIIHHIIRLGDRQVRLCMLEYEMLIVYQYVGDKQVISTAAM